MCGAPEAKRGGGRDEDRDPRRLHRRRPGVRRLVRAARRRRDHRLPRGDPAGAARRRAVRLRDRRHHPAAGALSPGGARRPPQPEAARLQRPDEQRRRPRGPDRAGDPAVRHRRDQPGRRGAPSGHETPRGLPAPSEMAWALILAVAKRTGIEDRVIRAGGWQTGFPVPLAGKTLGLLGAGHLGGAMVPVAKALRHGRRRVEPEPHRGAMRRARRHEGHQGRARCRPRTSSGSSSSSPSAPATRCAPTTWPR